MLKNISCVIYLTQSKGIWMFYMSKYVLHQMKKTFASCLCVWWKLLGFVFLIAVS